VRIETTNCAGTVTGRASGARLESGLVVTVAHAFEVRAAIELRDHQGRTAPAELYYLDLERDLALLAPTEDTDAGRGLHGLGLGTPEPGPAEFVTYADRDLGPIIEVVSITRLANVTLDGVGRRAAARLEGQIDPGDSGAPVVQNGELVAMVFASTRNVDLGWAVSATEIEAAVEGLERDGPSIEPLVC
jgi:S1-C subfamily serine protease